MEKHKICQMEVTQRDQTIIKIQSDYNLLHEKYASSLDELKIQQEEIERLNQRIKKQSNDLKEMQSINDRLEEKRVNMDKLIKQLEYEIEIDKQERAKQEKTIENIKADWTANIRIHEEEIKGYKQSYQILNEELAHTKADLSDFSNKITNLKQQVNELSGCLEAKNEENKNLNNEMSKFEQICKDQESKICQYSSELCITRSNLENAQVENSKLNSKLEEVSHRYEHAMQNIERLENGTKCLNETVIEFKFKMAEREQNIEILKNENLNLNQQLNSKCSEFKKIAQDNEALHDEIDKINEEYNKLIQCLEQTEMAVKQTQAKLSEKTDDVIYHSF